MDLSGIKKSFQGVKRNKKPSTRAPTKPKDCSSDGCKSGGATKTSSEEEVHG